MSEEGGERAAAIRQVLYYLSRDALIPESNPLLWSALVGERAHERWGLDTVEARTEALRTILRELVNDFAAEEPDGQRRQLVQQRTFDILFALLRGHPGARGVPERTYDRYHARAVRVLADRFQRREAEFMRRARDDPEPLRAAREAAAAHLSWLSTHPREIDLFLVDDLISEAGVIAEYDYYREAAPYFSQLHQRVIATLPDNRVQRRYRMAILRQLAHCQMNLGAIRRAAMEFSRVEALAHALDEAETQLHATHMLGVVYDLAGDWERSAAEFHQALRLANRGPDAQRRVAWIERDLAHALTKQHQYSAAMGPARSSLRAREALRDGPGYMMSLECLGRALAVQGRYSEASHALDEALRLADSVESALFRTIVLTTLADLQLRAGRPLFAKRYAQDGQRLARDRGLWRQYARLERLRRRLAAEADE